MKRRKSLKRARARAAAEQSEKRSGAAERSTSPAAALVWGFEEKPYYIAVSEHGFGVNTIPAMAIRMAQMSVPSRAKESQLLIYESMGFVKPVGFKDGAPVWPNHDASPRLCGLTTTHRAFRQSLR